MNIGKGVQEQRQKASLTRRIEGTGNEVKKNKIKKIANGKRKLEKRWYESRFSSKATGIYQNLLTSIPYSTAIYGARIHLATKKEKCKGEKRKDK